MSYQSYRSNTTPYTTTTGQTSQVPDMLIDAYLKDKKGVRYAMCENGSVVFQKCRPHSVLTFGLAYEDPRDGSVHVIMSHHQDIPAFSMLFRTQKSGDSYFIVFGDGLEISSDSSTNFAAFFCVKFQELEEVALYTVSKWGTETCCTENYSAHHLPPAHFCSTTFAILGGMKYAN